MNPGKTAAEPPVYGAPLGEILAHVWFDGFTSGASSGCGLFLPGEAADMKAVELASAAIRSPEIRAQVHVEIQERMRIFMAQAMKTAEAVPGLKPSDLGHFAQQPTTADKESR
ncbi:hypothetical protein [Candidatus Mycobacterium methanotrophicum]|uniref:Uncharacterized protein n=1 Tax=Candidatus Mycobacterium methanotrophicum TaxID=2943498 RepID=A0ABY4QRP3_9MYCO|nr:hypothetical protein [Candidatus Mycobacterium methanotrophicum]UQX13559.1 hypothetical protein M5I08_25545 [Candidatus Mycobacterium methanotrophicum]